MLKRFGYKDHVKTPSVLQIEASECGAVALAIILGHYGCHIPLEQLRAECGISRDGSKAINIVKTARRYGLQAQGLKVEDIDALQELKFPFIVFWEFNHYLVVEGINNDKVYLNDPAYGYRVMDRATFSRSFTGVVLAFEPTPDFKKMGKPSLLRDSIKERIQGEKNSLFFILLASLALVIPGIVIPGFSKIFIDNILIEQMHSWFSPLVIGMLVTALIRGAFSWFQQYFLLRLQIKFLLLSSARFMWHVLYLPINFFAQRYAGDVQERIEGNQRIAELLSGELSSNLANLINIVFFAMVMFLLAWQLAMIVMMVVLANVFLFYTISEKVADINYRLLQERARLRGIEMNALTLIETLKSMSIEGEFFSRWVGNHAKNINSQQTILTYNQLLVIVPKFFSNLMIAIILGLGSWLIIRGHLTIGTLVAFQSLSASLNGPVMQLLGLGNRLQQIRGDLIRQDDVLQHPEDDLLTRGEEVKYHDKQLQGRLELREISFGYAPLDPPLINKLNMCIKPGMSVAIVGHSGSGKSTFAKLICGLYQPWSGNIFYDGYVLKEISRETLANSLSFVDQDVFLFSGSIRDNLTLWNTTIEDSAIQQALSDVGMTETITKRGGLASQIIEGGSNFSGGEQQRLEIARALLNQPKLLVLDEATANLDQYMEEQIYNKLRARDCTLITITHRINAIKNCDIIYVMEKGSIIQQGTHDELSSQAGLYQQLQQAY